MTNGALAFLALAEELNFTKAAERMYISQQALSKQINRLEEQYNAMLVTRKPRVALTPAGEELLRMLQKQAAMEQDTSQRIAEIESGLAGGVSIGAYDAALRTFGMNVFSSYRRKYPDVHLDIAMEQSAILEEELLRWELDCILAVDPPLKSDWTVEPLFEDGNMLVVPVHIAEERGAQDVVDIEDYADLEFIRNRLRTRTNDIIDEFLNHKGIQLHSNLTINAYGAQLALASEHDMAMFCTESFASHCADSIRQAGMRVLRVRGMDQKVTVCLVKSADRFYPRAADNLFEEVRMILKA